MIAVVGSGIAGLYAALCAVRRLPGVPVTLFTKAQLGEGNTRYAQGGIAAVLPGAAGDSPQAHMHDTLEAGAGHGRQEAVEALCGDAAGHIEVLMQLGTGFDRDAGGRLARGREAAHSANRILHAGGDATGAGIIEALVRAVRSCPEITVAESTVVTGLRTAGGRISGLAVRGPGAVSDTVAQAQAVLLATGGAGALYTSTTNPDGATGDGVALAWRAGAATADLEFFQFHPTALDVPGNPLISEAVRGEGAVLRNDAGVRFLPRYTRLAELAPRDVVSRSIARHLQESGSTRVWLDVTGVAAEQGSGFLARRFPGLTALTRSHGLDWEREPVPVVPAAHYWMGGVRTDTAARTTVPGLYAIGEVACTGVHGANRLASNSLLEGLVFASRAVEAVAGQLDTRPWPQDRDGDPWPQPPEYDAAAPGSVPAAGAAAETDREEVPRHALQALMSTHAGILRSGTGLAEASHRLAAWREPGGSTPADLETANLLVCARLLVASALRRRESLGAHYRTDSPLLSGLHPAGRSFASTGTEIHP